MPDATITSTASTFGTISGVFSADQSTISGTISGIVPGTLTGSVGVPGPAGAAGQGVPAGGTAGQFLTKIDGTNYNTDWTTVNLSVYAVKSNNLSDLPSASTARTNLGLGSLAVVNDAPSDGSQYARKNAAWEVVTTTPDFISSVSSPLSVTTGNLTINLSAYAPLASPAFTGNPTAPTAALGDNDTSLATTAFVQQELASGVAVAKNLEVYVRNQSGSTIPAGSIVYISGATGNKPLITLAQANNDANSAQTMGFTKTAIANNGFGYVIVRGELENIDTSALTEGAQLYLSPTVAGTWTTTKPSAPQHLVYVGIVVRAHPTQGIILVAVQNGYELNELHDVAITSPTNGQVLKYNSSTNLWVNGTDSAGVAWGAITGTLSSQTDLQSALDLKLAATTAASTYQTLSGMSSYLTTSVAASTYQTQAAMSSYLTTSTAASTYALKTNGELKGNFTLDGTAASPNSDGSILIGSLSSGYNYLSLQAGVIQGVTYASGNKSFTLNGLEGLKLFSSGQGVRFPDATTQTTAYPGSSGFLLKADNLSGLANTGTARTNLGLGTMATATAADYSTTSAANLLYYPLSSNPAGYLTTAPVTSVAGRTGAITLAVADVSGAAPLASPSFSGNPSLPTGTTAVTQSAGNNTTAVATTAFVTAAVPALATITDSRQLTNDTKAMSPNDVLWSVMTQDYININRAGFTYTTAGTPQYNDVGSVTTRSRLNATVASSVIGRPFGTSQVDQTSPFLFRNNWGSNINFNLKTYLSGRTGTFALFTDATFNVAFYYGKVEGDAIGDLTRRGYGWKFTGGAGTRYVTLQVHNGTTLTNVTSSFAPTQEVAFDWDLYSDGAGNVTLYINGSQVATSSAGPTSYQSAGTYAWWREETWTTAAPSFGNHTAFFTRGRAAILNY